MTNPTIVVTDYHRALLGKIREDLMTGAIPRERFNMARFDSWTGCGTAHCIGDWMRHHAAEAGQPLDFDVTSMLSPFASLFYPTSPKGFGPEDYRRITPQQAIVAIGLWLDTGRVDWAGILESVR